MSDRRIAKPLWIRITAYGFAAVLFASLAIGGLAFYRQYQAGEDDLQNRLSQDVAFMKADIEGQKRTASALALIMAGEPSTGDLIEKGAREDLIRRFQGNLSAIKADASLSSITFIDANAKAVVRVHMPEKFGDDLSSRRQTVLAAIKSGDLKVGVESGLTSLAIFASAPVRGAGGQVVGVADVGTYLTPDYFARLKAAAKTDLAVQLVRDGRFEVQSSTFAGKPYLSQDELHAVLDGQNVQRLAEVDGHSYMAGGIPLIDFLGNKIGVLELAKDVTSVAEARSSALWSAALMTFAACAIVLVGFLVFARALGSAIGRLTAVMARLAAGDLEAEVPSQERADEIGAMARAVQVFKAAGIEKLRLEADAVEGGRAAGQERARNEAIQAQQAREQNMVVGSLAEGLVKLAEGDLTTRLQQPFAPAYEKLRMDFNGAVEQLRTTIDAVASNTSAIHSGSGEIAQAADDLSRRTEQQAASLEETAAALDEITTTVKQTAEGAKQASTVVAAAKTDAEHSGTVVRNAVDAMTQIESSSRQVSQIIGVIDEIAFQTNLLALNAGVEAARAGEAGRGFAVVASEVRALAQRSAEAAKQIKVLIQASTMQVESGVELVGETGRALDRIAAQVAEINGIVVTIAASAHEQSTGLQQVNTAVNQMDQVTQQNAAMVEQSTAASHSLLQEAVELAALVGRFKLTAGPSREYGHARAA